MCAIEIVSIIINIRAYYPIIRITTENLQTTSANAKAHLFVCVRQLLLLLLSISAVFCLRYQRLYMTAMNSGSHLSASASASDLSSIILKGKFAFINFFLLFIICTQIKHGFI